MPLSAEDRRYILVNTTIEHERMFTILARLCGDDPDKSTFLTEIETALKDCLKRLEERAE
jgi:hypothetical protein